MRKLVVLVAVMLVACTAINDFDNFRATGTGPVDMSMATDAQRGAKVFEACNPTASNCESGLVCKGPQDRGICVRDCGSGCGNEAECCSTNNSFCVPKCGGNNLCPTGLTCTSGKCVFPIFNCQ